MEYETQEVRKGLQAAGFEVEMQWYTPARIAHEFRTGSPICTWPDKWQDPERVFAKKPDRIFSIPLNLEGNESHSIPTGRLPPSRYFVSHENPISRAEIALSHRLSDSLCSTGKNHPDPLYFA